MGLHASAVQITPDLWVVTVLPGTRDEETFEVGFREAVPIAVADWLAARDPSAPLPEPDSLEVEYLLD